jgi:hypothetical protein
MTDDRPLPLFLREILPDRLWERREESYPCWPVGGIFF